MCRRYAVPARGVLIGRGNECDVRLDAEAVSRRHARIYYTPEGWRVEDLGSTNGTWVNDFPVQGVAALDDRDLIRCGRVWLRLQASPEPVPGSDRDGGGGGPSAVAFVTIEDDN